MSMQPSTDRLAAWLAVATGAVLLASLLCLIVFYAIGDPWGTVNDAGNGLAALLSAALAWRLTRPGDRWALLVAAAGAVIAVYGSYLVMSARTGWYLAGLYSSFGYALIGVWLWQASGGRAGEWPRGVARLGRSAGVCMALGLLAVPGILAGVDAAETAPWWAHIGFAGGLGWVLVYPLWCVWLGRAALAGRAVAHA